jgi:hypothetical protein
MYIMFVWYQDTRVRTRGCEPIVCLQKIKYSVIVYKYCPTMLAL